MNVHILLVMKHLNDNDSVTQEELLDNCRAAADVHYAAAIAFAVSTAAYATAAYATTAVAADVHYAKNAIDRYFNFAGENKQDYIDEITTNN